LKMLRYALGMLAVRLVTPCMHVCLQAETHFPPLYPDKRTKLVKKHRLMASAQAYLDRKRTGQMVDLERCGGGVVVTFVGVCALCVRVRYVCVMCACACACACVCVCVRGVSGVRGNTLFATHAAVRIVVFHSTHIRAFCRTTGRCGWV